MLNHFCLFVWWQIVNFFDHFGGGHKPKLLEPGPAGKVQGWWRNRVDQDGLVVLAIKRMSRADKLRTMEALWAELANDEARMDSPAGHAEALRETEGLVR